MLHVNITLGIVYHIRCIISRPPRQDCAARDAGAQEDSDNGPGAPAGEAEGGPASGGWTADSDSTTDSDSTADSDSGRA